MKISGPEITTVAGSRGAGSEALEEEAPPVADQALSLVGGTHLLILHSALGLLGGRLVLLDPGLDGVEVVDELDETERGAGGYGHTGVK